MNDKELILNIEKFKQQLAYSINNSQLPAEVCKYILNDFIVVLNQMAQQQLINATKPEEVDNNGKSTN